MPRLILIEDTGQVPALEKWILAEDPGLNDTAIIALTPESRVLLLEKGLPHECTVSYFGRTGHERVLSRSQNAMHMLREAVDLEDSYGNVQGYRHYILFNLRFFLHYLLFTAEVLHQACEIHRPEEIIVPESSPAGGTRENYARYPGQTAEIARAYCVHQGLDFSHLSDTPPGTKGPGRPLPGNRLRAYIKRFISWRFHWVFCLIHGLVSKKERRLLVSQRSNNMAGLVRRLSNILPEIAPSYLISGDNLWEIGRGMIGRAPWNYSLPEWLPESKLRPWKERVDGCLTKASRRLAEQAESLRFHGIDVVPNLVRFMAETLPDQLCRLYCQAWGIEQIFRKARPRIVISQLAYGATYLLGETARRYQVPSVMISHGSHTPPDSEFSQVEWKEHGLGLINTVYEYQAIQTPLARSYLEKIPSPSQGWITGPVLFSRKENEKGAICENRKRLLPGVDHRYTLMHAGTAKTIRDLRLYVYETNDEYIENLNHLIAEVERLEDVYLIVRFRPNWQLSEEAFKKLLIPGQNYGVYSGGDFQDYLSICDLLVSYSSTTIEEALQSEVPVLQYDPQGKYCHVKGRVLEGDGPQYPDTCYFVGDRNHLGPGLEWIIDYHLKHQSSLHLDWSRYRFNEDSIVRMEERLGQFLGQTHLQRGTE